MIKDLREQISREDIEEAIAALERGELHAFGPSTFYDLLIEDSDIRRKQSSALLPAERLAAHSALMNFLEVRNPGRFVCFASEVSMSWRSQGTSKLKLPKRLQREYGLRIQRPLLTAMADRDGNSAPAYGVLRAPRTGRIATRSCGS